MKLLAIIKRVMKELLRDKRTLALMFLAPIVILTLMYFIFNGDEENLELGVDKSVSSQIVNNLPDKNLNIKNYHSTNNIKSKIEKDDLDGFIYQDNKELHVVYTNEDPNKTSAIKQIVGQSLQKAKINGVKKVLEKNANGG
ncbi:membrane protein [Staphylococcus petrasii]|nr:membrane protein [Staphylococcus petrasii]